jgi:hypothetical protein
MLLLEKYKTYIMKKQKNAKRTIAATIIISAIIWGLIFINSATELKGTDCYDKIQNLLVVGAVSHLILIWIPLAILFRKKKINKI